MSKLKRIFDFVGLSGFQRKDEDASSSFEEFYSTREVLLETSMEEVKRVVAENCDFGNLDVRKRMTFSASPVCHESDAKSKRQHVRLCARFATNSSLSQSL